MTTSETPSTAPPAPATGSAAPAGPPRLTRRQQQANATKARIVEAALGLVAKQGYAATSTRQIAQAAGVSEGLIFRHFPTKLDLLHAVALHRRTFRQEMLALLRGSAEVPAAVCLRTIGDGFVELVRSQSQLLNVILGESRTNDELYEMFRAIVDDTTRALASYVEDRVAAGELRPDLSREGAARAFLGPLFLFFLTSKHLSDEQWREQATTHVTELLDTWLAGALRRPVPTTEGTEGEDRC